MMSTLSEHGRVGLTAVGDDPAEAERAYHEAEAALLDEGQAALAAPVLP